MTRPTDASILQRIRNAFIFPTGPKPDPYADKNGGRIPAFNRTAGGSNDVKKNLSNTQIPVAPSRKMQDVEGWREAVIMAERSIYPYRVKMQEQFRDTVLNTHVASCINKRKNMTLQRKFALVDASGKPNDEWTEYFKRQWFNYFVSYSIDAIFYGYSLISLGEIVDGELPRITTLRRDNISPERQNVVPAPYLLDGPSWNDPEYAPWHVWVQTQNEHGTTSCGFGLLYPVAYLEILMRNMLNNNSDFMELFASPYRALFMDISNEEERLNAQQALDSQGSLGYGVFGKEDKLEVLQGSGGNGYKSYADFQQRIEKNISKLLLGHSDAIESTPGKLGASQGGGNKPGGDHSPVQTALDEIMQSDAGFIEPIVNKELLTRLRFHGIDVPEELTFKFLNSEEEEDIQRKKNDVNLQLSSIVKNLTGSNLEVDPAYFEETTGIKVSKVEQPIIAPAQENNSSVFKK